MTRPEHWATVGTLHPGDRVLLTLDGRASEWEVVKVTENHDGHVGLFGHRPWIPAAIARLLLADVTPHHPVRRTRQAAQ